MIWPVPPARRRGGIDHESHYHELVADDLILQALREDITFEDVSTASVCPTARPATVELIAKADGIIAGLDVFSPHL